jgi:hypothetical protein
MFEIFINAFGEFGFNAQNALNTLIAAGAAYWVGLLAFAGGLSIYLIKKW